MDEMAGDEILTLLVAAALCVWGLWRFLIPMITVRYLRGGWQRWAVMGAVVLGFVPLVLVLRIWADKEVREEWMLFILFFCCGGALVSMLLRFSGLLGVDVRDDVIERRNSAAAAALAGAIIGLMLIFTGSNFGAGPTIWTTIGPALSGLAAWAVLWALLESTAGLSEAVTIERDLASGLRLGGLLLANGLVLGRAVAGDWKSLEAMGWQLAVLGWPAIVLTVLAVGMQLGLRPTAGIRRDATMTGLIPATLLAGGALLWVLGQGGIG